MVEDTGKLEIAHQNKYKSNKALNILTFQPSLPLIFWSICLFYRDTCKYCLCPHDSVCLWKSMPLTTWTNQTQFIALKFTSISILYSHLIALIWDHYNSQVIFFKVI